MPKYTKAQKAEALRVFHEDGAIAAAEAIGCHRTQVYRWFREDVARHTEKSEEELRIDAAYQQAMRLRTRRRLLDRIDDLMDRIDQEHIDFRGKDVQRVVFPTARSGDVKNYVTSIAILIDKYRLEMGEATGRLETLDLAAAESRVDEEILRLSEIHADA